MKREDEEVMPPRWMPAQHSNHVTKCKKWCHSHLVRMTPFLALRHMTLAEPCVVLLASSSHPLYMPSSAPMLLPVPTPRSHLHACILFLTPAVHLAIEMDPASPVLRPWPLANHVPASTTYHHKDCVVTRNLNLALYAVGKPPTMSSLAATTTLNLRRFSAAVCNDGAQQPRSRLCTVPACAHGGLQCPFPHPLDNTDNDNDRAAPPFTSPTPRSPPWTTPRQHTRSHPPPTSPHPCYRHHHCAAARHWRRPTMRRVSVPAA